MEHTLAFPITSLEAIGAVIGLALKFLKAELIGDNESKRLQHWECV